MGSSSLKYALKHPKCEFCGVMVAPETGPKAGHLTCDDACAAALRSQPVGEALATVLSPKLGPDYLPADIAIDPVTLEVMTGALMAICKEMARTMERAAYSPAFTEGADMTTALLDADFNLIGQYEGIPAQMGSMKFGVIGGVQTIGLENIAEGDVILHNDSYRGTPHLPEFCMVKPIFYEGDILGYAANIAHHTDVGGKARGSMPGDATEIFQEGVIIPPVKIIKAGVHDHELWSVYLANVRTPEQSYGDCMATLASVVVGENRFIELIGRHGRAEFELYARAVREAVERRMRAGVRTIPNGTYSGISYLDDDGVSDQSYEIRVAVTVLDEELIFDFRGSSPQAGGPVNAPYGVCLGACANALFNVLDPHVSHNEGAFAPINLIAPPGTVVNCNFPAPLNGGNTESHNMIVEAVMDALSKVIPDRVPAPSGSTVCLISGGGVQDGEQFTYVVWEGSGWGGMADRDGTTAVTTWVGVGSRTSPAEVLETRYPWRVIRRELRQDPGPGRHRGGLGCETEYEILGDDFEVSSISCRGRIPPGGRHGGGAGQLTEVRVVRDGQELLARHIQPNLICPTKFSGLRLRAGDRLIVRSPGGGGYGPPGERSRELIERDLHLGYIGPAAAQEVYGYRELVATSVEVNA
jgi:N-methylhydantoinase B